MRNTSSFVLRRSRAGCVVGLCVLLLAPVADLCAQEPASAAAASADDQLSAAMRFPIVEDAATVAVAQPSPPPSGVPEYTNPFAKRPVCASMFMKADWQLTRRQKVCDWIHNGVFSTNAMLGAVWSAGFSQSTDLESERGDGFPTRFGRRFAQSAFKSTGSYLGGQIFGEDPRKTPPYLVLRESSKSRGFFRRTGRALGNNFISYRCIANCSEESHVRKVPALSRVLGSLASGFAGELLTYDRPNSTRHALRGAGSAYGSTFINALFVEFRPELSAFAGKAFTRIFGVR